jgi:CDP-diacylglycerol--serine O-phosphatidyltransferase
MAFSLRALSVHPTPSRFLSVLRCSRLYSAPDPPAANEPDLMDDMSTTPKRPRGIYLLPNLFTTAALFAGFYAVLAATHGRFEAAALAIFAAMLLDGIDGRVARITQTQSDFGAEYDSLSDMVAFGVAPALVAYHWALGGLGKVGWLAAFVFTAAVALRLARFNTQVRIADKRYFQGLASPPAAAIIASGVWIGADLGIEGSDVSWLAAFLTAAAGLLMVSNFRYFSFKQLNIQGRVPFLLAVAVMLGFGVVFINPPLMLFAMAVTYAISGPIWTLARLRQSRLRHRRESR